MQKHESDLTKQEKRQLEKEKIKGLSFKERLVYLWTYYKIVLVIALAAVLVIGMVATMVHNAREINLLSVVVADGDPLNDKAQETLQKDFLKLLGSGSKREKVSVSLTSTAQDGSGSEVKAMIDISGIAENDVVICNQQTYEKYAKEGAFKDWKAVLGDKYDSYAAYFKDGALDISASPKWQELKMTLYQPAYLCVLTNSKNMKRMPQVLDYFLK